MKHLFVPYEIALKLKEKGFNELCLANYYDEIEVGMMLTIGNKYGYKYNQTPAPLYQQVIDWFREKYGLYIYMRPDRPNNIGDVEYVIEKQYDNQLFLSEIHMDYKLAIDAAIEKALTLI